MANLFIIEQKVVFDGEPRLFKTGWDALVVFDDRDSGLSHLKKMINDLGFRFPGYKVFRRLRKIQYCGEFGA